MRWLMSFRREDSPATRRGLVHRPGNGWNTAICFRADGSDRCPTGAGQRGLVTTQFEDTLYEVALPRVARLREQSHINVQSVQPLKFTEFVRKAPGKFDALVIREVEAALKRWLKL